MQVPQGFSKIVEYNDVNGISTVTKANAGNKKAFTIDGKQVGKDVNTLRNGIYIVNGKKIAK